MDRTLEHTQSEETERSLVVECSPAVLEQIHSDVAELFYLVPHGGAEAGGVLYGVRQDSRVLIQAARPLQCEHAFGPSFTLSSNDLARLEKLLQAPGREHSLAGMAVVGWYTSHTRSDLALTDADLEVHAKYFPEPWQVAMVLRPAMTEPTRVAYFLRGPDGNLCRPSLPPEFAIPFAPGAARRRPSVAAPLQPALMERSGLPPLPARPAAETPAGSPGPQSETLPARLTAPVVQDARKTPAAPPTLAAPRLLVETTPRRLSWLWLAGAVVLFLVVAQTAYVFRESWMPRSAEPPGTLRLQTLDRDGHVEVRWDGDSPIVRGARSGTLEITEGTRQHTVVLDAQFLRLGTITYVRHSPTVKFHLVVVSPDGSRFEQYSTLIGGPLPESTLAQAQQPAPPAPQPVAPEQPAAAARQDQLAQDRAAAAPPKGPASAYRPPEPRTATAVKPPPKTVPTAKPVQRPPQRAAMQPPAPRSGASGPAGAAGLTSAVPKPPPPSVPPQRAVTTAAQPEVRPARREPETRAVVPNSVASPPAGDKQVPVADKAVLSASKPAPEAAQRASAPPQVPPAASKPEPPVANPAPAPKTAAAEAKPAAPAPPSLAGQWMFSPSSPSGSPFRPEFIMVSVADNGSVVTGRLTARYRAPKSSGLKSDIAFTFQGTAAAGRMRFPWAGNDGTKGEVELIRIPNSDSVEVVWYPQDRRYIFDDVLQRVKR